MNKFNTADFFTRATNLRKEVVTLLHSDDIDDRRLGERLNMTLPPKVRVPILTTAHSPMRWRIS